MAPRKSNVAKTKGALCEAKDVSEPRGEERYCTDCWEKKIAVEEIVAREFALKRYIRAHSAEKYLIYHSTIKRPCGQIIVARDGDPEERTSGEILVAFVPPEVTEPWGGGKWTSKSSARPTRRRRIGTAK